MLEKEQIEAYKAKVKKATDQKAAELIEEAKQKAKDKEKELEPWMSAVATLQVLIRTTFEEADKEGLVEFRPYDESFVDIIKQDNSPSDQSAELSE